MKPLTVLTTIIMVFALVLINLNRGDFDKFRSDQRNINAKIMEIDQIKHDLQKHLDKYEDMDRKIAELQAICNQPKSATIKPVSGKRAAELDDLLDQSQLHAPWVPPTPATNLAAEALQRMAPGRTAQPKRVGDDTMNPFPPKHRTAPKPPRHSVPREPLE